MEWNGWVGSGGVVWVPQPGKLTPNYWGVIVQIGPDIYVATTNGDLARRAGSGVDSSARAGPPGAGMAAKTSSSIPKPYCDDSGNVASPSRWPELHCWGQRRLGRRPGRRRRRASGRWTPPTRWRPGTTTAGCRHWSLPPDQHRRPGALVQPQERHRPEQDGDRRMATTAAHEYNLHAEAAP